MRDPVEVLKMTGEEAAAYERQRQIPMVNADRSVVDAFAMVRAIWDRPPPPGTKIEMETDDGVYWSVVWTTPSVAGVVASGNSEIGSIDGLSHAIENAGKAYWEQIVQVAFPEEFAAFMEWRTRPQEEPPPPVRRLTRVVVSAVLPQGPRFREDSETKSDVVIRPLSSHHWGTRQFHDGVLLMDDFEVTDEIRKWLEEKIYPNARHIDQLKDVSPPSPDPAKNPFRIVISRRRRPLGPDGEDLVIRPLSDTTGLRANCYLVDDDVEMTDEVKEWINVSVQSRIRS